MSQGEPLASPFGDVIFAYTRADAIRDGTLVEIPVDLCREAGVVVPVAVTASVWDLIDPGNLETMPGQSVNGGPGPFVDAHLCCPIDPGRHRSVVVFQCDFLMCSQTFSRTAIPEQKTATLRAVCGPGDRANP